MLLLSIVTVLVMVSAQRRVQRVAEARSAYFDSAAETLALGGIEAAMVATHRREAPAANPLGAEIALSGGVGTLVVESSRDGDEVLVTSCARVTPTTVRGARAVSAHCVDATVTYGRRPVVRSWAERASDNGD